MRIHTKLQNCRAMKRENLNCELQKFPDLRHVNTKWVVTCVRANWGMCSMSG